jgi:uncharacterized protein (TIGR02284 family)
MNESETIEVLNDLIEVSRDGEQGFQTCADDAKDPALKSYFTICASRCRESARILADHVTRLGGSPEERGSVVGAAHRAWVDLKTALASNDDLAVLQECERGEDAALEAYRDALKKSLPGDVRAVIQGQTDGVQQNHDRIRAMRDERKRKSA